MDERVPAIAAPELDVHHGRVRVRLSGGQEDVRTVIVGEGPNGWQLWTQAIRFSLENTRFLDIGDAVYRSETIERVEPVTEDAPEPLAQALQACLAALTIIRDGQVGTPDDVRGLCADLLQTLERNGFHLTESD